LSRRYLRNIVHSLFSRRITVADHRQPNFVTLENIGADGTTSLYAVFLEVKRDRSRRRRLVPRPIGICAGQRTNEASGKGRKGRIRDPPARNIPWQKHPQLKERTRNGKVGMQKDQRPPFGGRRMRGSLSAFRQNSHSRWDPVSRAALRFSHPLVRSIEGRMLPPGKCQVNSSA
jgi:hypothetical protein